MTCLLFFSVCLFVFLNQDFLWMMISHEELDYIMNKPKLHISKIPNVFNCIVCLPGDWMWIVSTQHHRPPWFVIRLNYSEKNSQLLIKSSSMDWRVSKSKGEWKAAAELFLGKFLSEGLCHHHWLWILFVPVLQYKNSVRVCQQDRFYILEMRGRERDSGRSFILSMPHQHSDHIAFISDPTTLLRLPSSFLFWFISLHCCKQNFLLCNDSHLSSFRKCYTITVAIVRNSLLPTVRRTPAFETNWHF